jgi:hypothetical protein
MLNASFDAPVELAWRSDEKIDPILFFLCAEAVGEKHRRPDSAGELGRHFGDDDTRAMRPSTAPWRMRKISTRHQRVQLGPDPIWGVRVDMPTATMAR